jgi:sterol 24-C-methyltransferase
MRRVKPLIGAIGTLSPEEYTSFLKQAGFKILVDRNASVDGLTSALIDRADKFFTRLTGLVHFLVRYRVIPAHFKTLLDRLTMDGQAFVEADRKRLMTTSHYIIAEKPK